MKNGIAIVVATLGLALLVTVVACRKSGGKGRTETVTIYPTSATACDVDKHTVTLRKSLDSVSWQPKDKKAYTVIFQSGTPFKENGHPKDKFPVDPTSGIQSPVPDQNGYFEYSINDSAGNQCKDSKDPGVIVH